MINTQKIHDKVIINLKKVFDPEIPVNIYDLGLVYNIGLFEKNHITHCHILMTLTSPACPVAESLIEQARLVTKVIDEIDEVTIELTFNPPWDKDKMSEEGKDILMVSGAVI